MLREGIDINMYTVALAWAQPHSGEALEMMCVCGRMMLAYGK